MLKKNIPSSLHDNIHTIDDVKNLMRIYAEEGRRWGLRVLSPTLAKEAKFSVMSEPDLDRVLRGFDIDQDKKVFKLKDIASPTLHIKSDEAKISRLRNASKSAGHNLYTTSALRVWHEKGFKQARRIEIQDEKICPLCVVKNGDTYDIDYLLTKDKPLTFDTHSGCRGSFIPLIGSISKDDKHTPNDIVKDIEAAGNKATDVPVEYSPFIEIFLKRIGKLDFKVKFDKEVEFDYKYSKGILTINPRSSHHVDPREVIARVQARKMWPRIEKRFKEEYGVLLKLGLVHPNRASQTWPELFENTYKEYKLNQLDEPYEVLWCKSNLI